MKIAVVTNDQETISQHFGRSRYYMIYTSDGSKITHSRLLERTTGHYAKNQNQHHHQGHHQGPEADQKHTSMLNELADCQALISGGMGPGAFDKFVSSGLDVVLTDKRDILESVELYIQGKLKNLAKERLC